MLKIMPNFALFNTVKIWGGVGKISKSINEVSPTMEPPKYIWQLFSIRLLRAVYWWKRKKERKRVHQ